MKKAAYKQRRGAASAKLKHVFSLLLGTACGPLGHATGVTPVQDSSGASAAASIAFYGGAQGAATVVAPHCAVVPVGTTVEFRNLEPQRPARVTGLAGPEILSSPALVRPYNYVGPGDPTNVGPCITGPGGACLRAVAYSFWRYTFKKPGVYDFVDGARASDVRILPLPDGSVAYDLRVGAPAFGTLCVLQPPRPGDASDIGCAGVCCRVDTDCSAPARCMFAIPESSAATGRCWVPAQ